MFDLRMHQELAYPLRSIYYRCRIILCECSRLFPHQSRVNRLIGKLYAVFGSLKCELDSMYFRVVPNPSDAEIIYYGPDEEAPPVRYSKYLDEDLDAQRQQLNLITQNLRNSINTKAISLLDKVLTAFDDLLEELKTRPTPKKRPARDMELSIPWRGFDLDDPSTYSQRHKDTVRGDFTGHECEFCAPINNDDPSHPTLPAYAERGMYGVGWNGLRVWCKHCWTFHLHGAKDDPLNGTGDGNRSTHCHQSPDEGPGYSGYRIKCVGLFTDEIKNAHRASQDTRLRLEREKDEAHRKTGETAYIKKLSIVCGHCVQLVNDPDDWHKSKRQRGGYTSHCDHCGHIVNIHVDEWSEIEEPRFFKNLA